MIKANSQCGRTRWLRGSALACGVAVLNIGCSDDMDDSAEPAVDAAVTDAAAVGEVEAGVDDASVPGAPGIDAALLEDAGVVDGSTSVPESDAGDAGMSDAGDMDAAFDATVPGAQVFIPDGGVVLR